MKHTVILVSVILFCSCGTSEKGSTHHDNHGHSNAIDDGKKKPKSPKQMAMSNIGENHVHIEYSSPGKRGRQIFGGLVAYGEVWVTGAHKATSIQFSKDVEIGDTAIKAGKYALFTIPGEAEWTIIINKNWDQHLADDYSEAEDIVRLKVNPEKLNETVESLTYEVQAIDDNTGIIAISWDDVKVSFKIKNAQS